MNRKYILYVYFLKKLPTNTFLVLYSMILYSVVTEPPAPQKNTKL